MLLAGQRAWIAARAEATDAAPGVGSLQLMVDEWEIAIEEGQEIEVQGVCSREAMPGLVGSYREVATALVLRAPPGGALEISGLGESASTATARARDPAGARETSTRASDRARKAPASAGAPAKTSSGWPTDRAIVVITAVFSGLGVLVAWWLSR